MSRRPSNLPALLDRLESLHGRPKRPLPKRALGWILWKNAAYLVPEAPRRVVNARILEAIGGRASSLRALPLERLRKIAKLGGPMADRRVEKLLPIADTVEEELGGDLESALALPLPKARRALKRFPGIGTPGAKRILLFTGTHVLPAGVSFLTPFAEQGGPWLRRAHDLLRTHGQTLCKLREPRCDECPMAKDYPASA